MTGNLLLDGYLTLGISMTALGALIFFFTLMVCAIDSDPRGVFADGCFIAGACAATGWLFPFLIPAALGYGIYRLVTTNE